MQTLEFFEVYQAVDEHSSKVLGRFSSEILAETVAQENPGFYGTPSRVAKTSIQLYDDIWEWIGVKQTICQP